MDIKMAKIFDEWQKLFDLKCDTLDDFLLFYSGVHNGVKKLKVAESVAITDDRFIKAFLCRAID